jgi:hypothetical protein
LNFLWPGWTVIEVCDTDLVHPESLSSIDDLLAHRLSWTYGLDLGIARLRNFMWHPVDEGGVLSDFDIPVSAKPSLGPITGGKSYTEPGDLMVSELLGCKEFCKLRAKRVYLDCIEPFVWILVGMCLGDGGMEGRT